MVEKTFTSEFSIVGAGASLGVSGAAGAAAGAQIGQREAEHQQKYREEHIGGTGDHGAQHRRMKRQQNRDGDTRGFRQAERAKRAEKKRGDQCEQFAASGRISARSPFRPGACAFASRFIERLRKARKAAETAVPVWAQFIVLFSST